MATKEQLVLEAIESLGSQAKPIEISTWIYRKHNQRFTTASISSHKYHLKTKGLLPKGEQNGQPSHPVATDLRSEIKFIEWLNNKGVQFDEFKGYLNLVKEASDLCGGPGYLEDCIAFWETAAEALKNAGK